MKRDARGTDHMVRFTRPSGSVFAYCKRSKTGAGEGLGTRLGGAGVCRCALVEGGAGVCRCALVEGGAGVCR